MSPRRGRPRIEREIRITPIPRDEIDVRRLARALLALAQAEHPDDPRVAGKEVPDETA